MTTQTPRPLIHKLLIIGSGPAGLTAGVYAGRANLNPLIFEGETPGGQLMGTTYVENWPGITSILGPQLMINMREHAQHFGSKLIAETVQRVDFSQRPFTLWTDKDEYKAHSIIIATGAIPNRLGCPGENHYWGKGVTTCAVCDGAFYKDRSVVVVGGGDTAMEDASFLARFTDKITIVQIKDQLTASPPMKKRILDNPAIKIIYSSTVQEIMGNNDHVTGLLIKNMATGQEKTLAADGIFVAVGLRPSTTVFKDYLAMDQHGYLILTNHTHTNIEGIFGAGDAADFRYRQAITSAGTGCMAALDAERYLSEKQLLS